MGKPSCIYQSADDHFIFYSPLAVQLRLRQQWIPFAEREAKHSLPSTSLASRYGRRPPTDPGETFFPPKYVSDTRLSKPKHAMGLVLRSPFRARAVWSGHATMSRHAWTCHQSRRSTVLKSRKYVPYCIQISPAVLRSRSRPSRLISVAGFMCLVQSDGQSKPLEPG